MYMTLKYILTEIPKDELEKIKEGFFQKANLVLITNIVSYQGIHGLGMWTEFLYLDSSFFYQQLAYKAINLHDITLLETILPRNNINLQDTKTDLALLHVGVKACVHRSKLTTPSTTHEDQQAIIKLFFDKGANGKLADNQGHTHEQLAVALGNFALATNFKAERQRIKLAPFLKSLHARISQLESKCNMLDMARIQLSLDLKKHDSIIVEAQAAQNKPLAVSEALIKMSNDQKLKADSHSNQNLLLEGAQHK